MDRGSRRAPSRRGRGRAWARELVGAFDPIASPEAIDAASRAVEDFYAWAEGWIDDRRHRAGTDLLSTLIAAEQGGDRLSLEELQANVPLLTLRALRRPST